VQDETVKSLVRALSAVACFDAEHPTHTITSLANLAGLSRPTARRILLTLVEEGYAVEVGGGYRLTPQLLSLGLTSFGGTTLAQVTGPRLRTIADALGEVALAAVRVGGHPAYLAQAAPRKIIQVALPAGLARGRHEGAFDQALVSPADPGRVWTADGDPIAGLNSAAVQVRGRGGVVQLALGCVVSVPLDEARRALIGEHLRASASELEADLAHLVHLDPRVETVGL